MSKLTENDAEKSLISALVQIYGLRSDPPTREEVENMAKMIAPSIPFNGSFVLVVEEVLINIDTRMGLGISLVDEEANHDQEWVNKSSSIEWVYTKAYENFLLTEKWNKYVVQNLSDVGKNILGLLQDPSSEGKWNRRGLVIGHVQSGKTANYLGLIARAADAGYKFIIVIAGIHNNLRTQTQERVDAAFVGRSSDPSDNRKPIGVGIAGGKDYPYPATLTNIHTDFNRATAGQSGWKLNDFSKPIILVIKKNVSTLKSLHDWLKDLNAQGHGRITDIPMLLVDDEADNASINTNKEELDPTKTNYLIRKILGLFDKSCYVGYTATPFANIFINPESYDDEAREELFPKDFIYCLDAPSTYFGPDKVFRDEFSSELILRTIEDGENYLPLSHKKTHSIEELPPSLYEAINQFLIVKAIRNLRGQKNKHCSMMINVSRFIDIQNLVKDHVSLYLKYVEEAIRSNYKMSEQFSNNNEYVKALKKSFHEQFSLCGFDWLEVKAKLHGVFDTFKVAVINGKSQDSLNYKDFEKEGKGLTFIAIGGLSLSRGLTIEGLCISYMYRNTKMYDTLMQMGRWFGYRIGYEDMCRVYLNDDSINWYTHIADSVEELTGQIKQMRRDRLSPKQFGLYVKDHPDTLMITAKNKMRAGTEVVLEQNFSGKLVESYLLPDSNEINKQNMGLIDKYWRGGFGKDLANIEETNKGWIIKDVAIENIEKFLLEFKTHSNFSPVKKWVLDYLNVIANLYPMADVLLISNEPNGSEDAPFILGAQERNTCTKHLGYWTTSRMRVASRGDEKLGLDDDVIDSIKSELANQVPIKKPSDYHYRMARKKPLLMLHNLSLATAKSNEKQCDVPSFGVSFPFGAYSKSVKAVVNRVWFETMCGPIASIDEEGEDDCE